MLNLKNKHYLSLLIIFLVAIGINFYPLEKYVMKPGNAYDVEQFITVKNGDTDDEGSFSLMTVSIGKATPVSYLIAKLSKHQEIMEVEEVRQQGEDDEEYQVRQLKLMSDSQFNALYVAFTKANKPFTVSYKGVYVLNILDGGAADKILKPGDIVTEVDDEVIQRQNQLVDLLATKKKGDVVKIVIERDEKLLAEEIKLKEIPGSDGRIGLGITFGESKTIKTDPSVKADTEKIGGPSAGLMFTLEILNQLLDEDLTKGYHIAGTGEMKENGEVGRIGGVDKKVVAAHRKDIEIFFVPDDEITDEMRKYNPNIRSNYEVALETAKEIGTTMKIVPVKTIDDALEYLDALEPKSN